MARKRTWSEANSPSKEKGTGEAAIIYDIDELDDISSATSTAMDQDISFSAVDAAQLEGVPEAILGKIFEYILLRRKMIQPQFRTGTLRDGIYSANEDDTGVSTAPNIDSSVLRINKRLRNIAIEVLYGRNTFFFDSAEICRWWCKQIGRENLAGVRHINLTLNSGWWVEVDGLREREAVVVGTSDCCYEEMWYTAICRLLNATTLKTIVIKIDHWDDRTMWPPVRTPEETSELVGWRSAVIQKLTKFRGLKSVDISQEGCRWLGRWEVLDLNLLMRQRKSPLALRPKIGLSKLIANIRFNRLQRERLQRPQG